MNKGINKLSTRKEMMSFMEKKLIFSQSDFLYTLAGASALTGILVFFTQI